MNKKLHPSNLGAKNTNIPPTATVKRQVKTTTTGINIKQIKMPQMTRDRA